MAEGREGRLTRGQMAAINQVSKKTLLVYEEKDLLVPDMVDGATGYRYYSYEQCSTLDIIQQLQTTGATLAEIREVLASRDLDRTAELLHRQLDELRRREREIDIAKRTAANLLETCRLCRETPACGVVRLAWVPRRRIVFFPTEPYRFEPRPTDENPGLRRWEKALRSIKRDFPKRGLPLSLFHNIGCILSRASLLTRQYECIGGFIANEEGFGTGAPEYWEEGWCLSTVIDTVFLPDGSHAEYYWVDRLLDIAAANGFAIRNHYYCDILAETPAFFYAGRDMMMRLRVPVDLGGNPGPYEGVDEMGDDPA